MDNETTADTRARSREAASEVRDTSPDSVRASRSAALEGAAFGAMDYVAGALVLVMIWGPLLAGAIRG